MKKHVVAVGFFDGVHKGHKALIDKTIAVANEKNLTPAIFTFKNHPKKVVFDEEVKLLCSNFEKKEIIKSISGVSDVFFWDLTKETAKMNWEEFVFKILVEEINALHIITGDDFKFGYKNQGNTTKLEKLCKENGIGFDIINQVEIDKKRVSSTIIRQFIENGDIKKANEYLGYTYFVNGVVEHGRKVGRTIQFPTINISLNKEKQALANGVYVSCVTISGKRYMSTTNIGTVPTFLDSKTVKVEAHILDFDSDVYGKQVKIEFLEFLRPEKKFNGISQLKEEISKNIKQTREYFEKNPL